MQKKGQVLIIGLWILAVLTMLVISVGHRVSMALRLSRYQKDRLKALCLAKAGINRAIAVLEEDAKMSNYDAADESWADNKEVFEKIVPGENPNEFATVSYTVEEDDKEETKFGVTDEERKININKVPQGLLEAFLNDIGVIKSSEVAHNICAWRGDTGISIPDYSDSGYSNKGKKFTNIEELALVKGIEEIDHDTYERLKELITVWGEEKVNINTASQEILEILINTSYNKLLKRGIDVENPEGLLKSILAYRESGVFRDIDLESKLTDLSVLQKNIITDSTDGLKNKISVQSNNFLIEVTGNVSKINSKVRAIQRKDKKTLYWHES